MAFFEKHNKLGHIVLDEGRPVVAFNLFAIAHSIATFEKIGAHGGRFTEDFIRSVARSIWQGLAPDGERENFTK